MGQLTHLQNVWKSELDSRCGPDTCQKINKKGTRGDNWGFKESREAAINVIPSLGFNVNELGDHIPNPQTHSSHTKLFLRLSPKSKKEKRPSVDKSLTKRFGFACNSVSERVNARIPAGDSYPCSVVRTAYSKHPFLPADRR